MPTISELFEKYNVVQAPMEKQSRESEYLEFARIVKSLVPMINNKDSEKIIISMIRNEIFALPNILTGMVSVEAANLSWNKRTKEHFFGRTKSAKRLIRELQRNPNRSDRAIVAFLKSRGRVHQVTQKQNEDLKSYNKKNPDAHPNKAYAECNVILIKSERKRKYVYIVDDIEYNTLQQVADEYGLSLEGARYRFTKSKKFPTWIKKEL